MSYPYPMLIIASTSTTVPSAISITTSNGSARSSPASRARATAPPRGASGLSEKTCLPPAMPARTNSPWVGPHEVTSTASTPSSPIRSCPVSCTVTAPGRSLATVRAWSASTSDSAATRAPDSTRVNRRMWSFPIIPTPITPTFTVMVVSSPKALDAGSLLPRRPRPDAQLVHLRLQDVCRLGRRTPAGLQLVAELLQLGTAGHQTGQLVAGDRVLLGVPEDPAPLEGQEPVADRERRARR